MTSYQCEVCQRFFTQKYHLDRHSRLHTGEKPYSCEYCQKSFSRNEHLTNHIRVHTGERPFPCDFCEKTFSKKYHKSRHELRLHYVEFGEPRNVSKSQIEPPSSRGQTSKKKSKKEKAKTNHNLYYHVGSM